MAISKAHKVKFTELIRIFNQKKAGELESDLLIIHHPAVLGDNYEELITNLDLLAESEMKLVIVPPSQREIKS